MNPNQNTNMQNATSVPTSTGVSNVSSTSLNMPDKSVESSKPGSDVVFQDKPKKNMGMILTIVLLVLLAAGGIGFGVWATMDGNSQVAKKDEQIADLRSQLVEKNEVVAEDDITVVDDVKNNDDAMGEGNVDTADYIYVEDWGVKIKVPDNLEVLTYMYDHAGANTVLKVSGATKDGQMVPDFASISKCKLGVVERFSRANVEAGMVPDWYAPAFMSDDNYDYYYNGPQMLCTEVQGNADWEQSTVNIIKEMLTQPNNYYKI